MSGFFKASAAFLSIIMMAGAALSAGLPSYGGNLQQAILAEVYRAFTVFITPLSSVSGQGLVIESGGLYATSNHGLWPLLILLVAGIVVGLLSGNLGTALAASFVGSVVMIVGWQLLNFFILPLGSTDYSWVSQLDSVFYAMLYLRPLEMTMTVILPALSSGLVGWALEGRVNRSQEEAEPPLFPWRDRRKKL